MTVIENNAYYFPDLGELTLEVHADAVRRFCLARRHAVSAIDDPRRQLFELARLGVPDSPDDLTYLVLYELVLRRGAERGAFELRAPAREVAETAVALEDAVGLHVVARNAAMSPEAALRLVVGLLERETSSRLAEPAAAGQEGGYA